MKDLNSSYVDRKNCLDKLEEIASLENNWDHKGAKAFSKEQIMKVRDLILFLPVLPEIFPTAYGIIQLNYQREDGNSLKVEIGGEDSIRIYEEYSDVRENERIVNADIGTLNRIVQSFYKERSK